MNLVLLGDPVAHSRSPAIHQAALAAEGIEGSYEGRRVDAGGLAAAVAEMRSGELDGANVTMPHKQAAADLVDQLSPHAGRAGAVNTLVRVDGGVRGHLTDVAGVQGAWAARRLPVDGPVLVLGAGGAAAAALLAVEGRPVWLSARRRAAASRLAQRLGIDAALMEWGTPLPGAVVVNATPLGMAGESLPGAVVDEAVGLLDMPYGDEPTPATQRLLDRGGPVADGLEMLLWQAAVSFRLWTGRRAPISAMRAALT